MRISDWSSDVCSSDLIPESVLPKVCASDAHFGTIDKKHFGVSIPITGVAGDQQAALIGQRCFKDDMVKATFGTGGFLLMNRSEERRVGKECVSKFRARCGTYT